MVLGEVDLAWYPLRLTARDLTIRHRGRTDIPPLIVVSSFTVDLKPMDLWSSTVEHVKVDGMEIHIPPKDDATGKRPIPRPQKENGTNDESSRGGFLIRRLTRKRFWVTIRHLRTATYIGNTKCAYGQSRHR